MASLSELASQRKSDLKAISKWTRAWDAKQEAFEREVKRLTNRKRAIPDAADLKRLENMLSASADAFDILADLMVDLAGSWT